MSYLLLTDFVGPHKLAKSTQLNVDLQAFINTWEAIYVRQILGVELGNLLLTNLGDPSQDARFVILEDPFQLQPDDNCENTIHESRGLRYILTALIYYQYTLKTQARPGQQGMSLNQSETADTLSPRASARKGEAAWNDVLDDIEAIQWYCHTYDPDEYPEYKGATFQTQYSSFL